MARFLDAVDAPAGSRFILQGNIAFALGVVHAGYHAADGYPGTPSTEVIDRGLAQAQDRIQAGWSVNEAVAVNVAVGRAIAGFDTVVTMKIPGVFQAGDAISTSAFFPGKAGALVIYAATDYVPSSTQHVIDARFFFASARLPVLEPRDHQEMYEIAWTAADMSREFDTPVVVLASGILGHSEGLVTTREPRRVTPRKMPADLHDWMLMPSIARNNYNKATSERIPRIQAWLENSNLLSMTRGSDEWGIITSGESGIIVKEALRALGAAPSLLTLAATNPLPAGAIREFARGVRGRLFVIEDGDRFLEERVRLLGIEAAGKEENSVTTDWSPEKVIGFLAEHLGIEHEFKKSGVNVEPVPRAPSICPGCSYKAIGLAIAKLKRRKKLYAAFGDIGCSTLLHYMNALDTVSCMGASDSMRQGLVMSRPEMASRVVSIIGDSCECHCGLDSTRNAVFRNVPGVKIILDNRVTAMTGGQPAPSSDHNLASESHKFSLKKAVGAEVERTRVVDAFNVEQVEQELEEALDLAADGIFSALILEGSCIHEVLSEQRARACTIDYEKCKSCGLCDICPGIELDENKTPRFTGLCTNCGGGSRVCVQYCPFDAIVPVDHAAGKAPRDLPPIEHPKETAVSKDKLPASLRIAIRGIGGQGNLFFGNVLSEVAMRTPYAQMNIIKGDTHGMAQLGGSVISTFGCGEVDSPIPAPASVDVLVVMEAGEALRPGFIGLLKPGGAIILNEFTALPANVKKDDYPAPAAIERALRNCDVIKINAEGIARGLGDKTGKTSNVAVLGLLSTIPPLNEIPRDIWLSALMAVSPTDKIKSANQAAFNAGRKRGC